MSKNIVQGKKGEEIAGKFLEEKGYEVLKRNFRSGRAEIDLIVKKENILVFVEVKLRNKTWYGMPEDSVNNRKADLIVDAAENFIFEIDWKGPIRFDIISIKGQKDILHLEDAFG